jgi:hypothetical protein
LEGYHFSGSQNWFYDIGTGEAKQILKISATIVTNWKQLFETIFDLIVSQLGEGGAIHNIGTREAK